MIEIFLFYVFALRVLTFSIYLFFLVLGAKWKNVGKVVEANEVKLTLKLTTTFAFKQKQQSLEFEFSP